MLQSLCLVYCRVGIHCKYALAQECLVFVREVDFCNLSCQIFLEESLVESTKREIILFLESPYLPPRLDALRNRAIDWLRTNALPFTKT